MRTTLIFHFRKVVESTSRSLAIGRPGACALPGLVFRNVWPLDTYSFVINDPERSYSNLCLNVVGLGFHPNSILM